MCSIGSVISEKLLNKLTDKQTFYSFDTKIKTIFSMVRPFWLNYWTNRQTFYYFDTKAKTILSMVQIMHFEWIIKQTNRHTFIIRSPRSRWSLAVIFILSVCSSYRPSVLVSLSKLVRTSPSKPLNRLSSNFQGMFHETPSCASSHYFSDMSVRVSVNQLSISLSYFH